MTRYSNSFPSYSHSGSGQNHSLSAPLSTQAAYIRLLRRIIAARPFRLAVSVVIVVLVVHGGWSVHVAAEESAARQQQLAAAQAASAKSKVFSEQLSKLLGGSANTTVSVAVVSPYLGVQEFGSKQVFDAASTGKILTAALYLHKVELGQANLNQKIQGYDARELLDAMIIKSDDGAWTILNGYLTHPALQHYAQSLGLTSYTVDTNTMSSRDMANLLSLLEDGNLLQGAYRQLLLTEMAQANYRDYIVPAVNPAYKAFHKVGIDDDVVNDAAIIKNGKQSLILVIYTDGHGSYGWPSRAALMQAITHDAEAAYL